jgi:hypothetical protein
MDIRYVTRSGFLDDCEKAIRDGRERLGNGQALRIAFDDGGFPGRVIVTIREDHPACFNSDWESSDPTRFPARIRAAATALFNCGCHGSDEIVHADGELSIQVVGGTAVRS